MKWEKSLYGSLNEPAKKLASQGKLDVHDYFARKGRFNFSVQQNLDLIWHASISDHISEIDILDEEDFDSFDAAKAWCEKWIAGE